MTAEAEADRSGPTEGRQDAVGAPVGERRCGGRPEGGGGRAESPRLRGGQVGGRVQSHTGRSEARGAGRGEARAGPGEHRQAVLLVPKDRLGGEAPRALSLRGAEEQV